MFKLESVNDNMRTLLRRWAAYGHNTKRDKAIESVYRDTVRLLGDISSAEHRKRWVIDRDDHSVSKQEQADA